MWRKRIISIQVGVCSDTYPCMHTVTIHYSNGKKENRELNAFNIVKDYKSHLNADDQNHFQTYLLEIDDDRPRRKCTIM